VFGNTPLRSSILDGIGGGQRAAHSRSAITERRLRMLSNSLRSSATWRHTGAPPSIGCAHTAAARRINGERKMVVELRIYHCAPGRLPALLDRFQNTTLDFFEQYGIRQVGFWTTLIGPDNHVLTYLLQWESLAEREQKWNAFQADPEWIAKRAASEVEKPIVTRIESQFLTPTAFSALR
jgi:NIPSNAP